jgi:hypothetical protein
MLLDTQFLATFGIPVAAEGFSLFDALVDDFRFQVLGGNHSRGKKLRWRVIERHFGFRCFAGQQLHSNIGCSSGNNLAWFRDRVVLVARDNQLKRGNRRVIARYRRNRIEPRRLEGSDSRTASTVIGGDYSENLVAETGDLTAGPFLSLGWRPDECLS